MPSNRKQTAFMPMSLGLFDERKFRAFCRILEVPPCYGAGILYSLWAETYKSRTHGDWGALQPLDIAVAIGYVDTESLVENSRAEKARAEKLIHALFHAGLNDGPGFIEKNRDGGYRLYNWAENSAFVVCKRGQDRQHVDNAAKQRAYRMRAKAKVAVASGEAVVPVAPVAIDPSEDVFDPGAQANKSMDTVKADHAVKNSILSKVPQEWKNLWDGQSGIQSMGKKYPLGYQVAILRKWLMQWEADVLTGEPNPTGDYPVTRKVAARKDVVEFPE